MASFAGLVVSLLSQESLRYVITVSLFGGLGNQMFQYAAGKALAASHGVDLALDLNGLRNPSQRPFLLDRLSVPEACGDTIPDRSTNYFFRGLWKKRIDRVLERVRLPKFSIAFGQYFEPHFHYDPAFEALGPRTALFGHFQSERYFSSITESLRDWFTPREPLGAKAVEMRGRIEICRSSVSVHIRRGDYLNSGTVETHGILGEAYYRNAIDRIDMTLGDQPYLFVFSDELDAAERLLSFLPNSRLHFVRGDPDRPWEDMALMARCRHHVIANSSFSWWGAWLNRARDKVVVAPHSWFAPAELSKRNTADLYPQDWILV